MNQGLDSQHDGDVQEIGVPVGTQITDFPPAMERDWSTTIFLLRGGGREAFAGPLLATLGVGNNGSIEVDPKADVSCEEVDGLVANLRDADQLSPRLDSSITNIRTQVVGQPKYGEIMGRLQPGDFEAASGVIKEMEARHVYPNKEILRLWLCTAETFVQGMTVYNYMRNYTFTNAEGETECNYSPDLSTIRKWLSLCDRPQHFKMVIVAYEALGDDMNVFPFEEWSSCCSEVGEFEDFFKYILELKVRSSVNFKPDESVVLKWLSVLKTPKQFEYWLFAVNYCNFIPNRRMRNALRGNFNLEGNSSVEQLDEDPYMKVFYEIIGRGPNSYEWTGFLGLLRKKLSVR